MKNKIFITGVAGFVGSNFAHEALKQGNEILGIDNFINSTPKNVDKLKKLFPGKINFAELDLVNDRDQLAKLLGVFEPDIVIHFAGLKSVIESEINQILYWKNNVSSSINLIDAMIETKTRKIIFSSSASIYGTSKKQPVTEKYDPSPISTYGKTKLMVESILGEFSDSGLIDTVILRYFNIIGANQETLFCENIDNSTSLMANIIKVARGTSDKLYIYGKGFKTTDGTAERDFIHVDDLIDAHMRSIEFLNDRSGKYIFNVGTGRSTSVLELKKIFEEVNNIQIEYEFLDARLADLPFGYANPKRIGDAMRWSAKKNVAEMCRDSWEALKIE